MATVAANVPGLYDLVVNVSGGNTTGFVFNDALESSLPFRTHKATYTYSPTFIQRQNVQGDFGDNQQDFFQTATQKDWSLGENQRFFRSTDDDAKRRFWSGAYLDISTPGQVSMQPQFAATGPGSGVQYTAGPYPGAASLAVLTATNLWKLDANKTWTDKGAHGLAGAPSRYGFAADNKYAYFTDGASIRKYDGTTFSAFSAAPSSPVSLAFLNNTLYGLSTSALIRYDTAGTATTLFTWKGAEGTAEAATTVQAIPFGGKLAILRVTGRGSELWLYDGTAPTLTERFPSGTRIDQIAESLGTIYASGVTNDRAIVMYYAGGSIGLLSQSPTAQSTPLVPGLCAFRGGLLFGDDNAALVFYEPSTGGIAPIATTSTASGTGILLVGNATTSGSSSFMLGFTSGTGACGFWPDSTKTTVSIVTTSLFDFESSLKKYMRGITVEFDAATDGNGGSVDVAYRLEDVDGSYTSLATGVTSGTETTLSGISGKRISVQVTLNKGTSTNGPVLKRIYVRAAPIQTRFKQREYILSCIGDPASEDRQILRDGMSSHPLAGRKQADQLVLAAASQTPLTLTDRFGTYTGIIETLEIYEQHANNDDPSASGSFVVKVATREI